MDDDLNTADAISTIFEMVRFTNSCTNTESASEFAKALYIVLFKLCDTVLGIHPERKAAEMEGDEVAEIEALIAERTCSKRRKRILQEFCTC
jgi:Cysteinyl-tRNA synthetase